MKPSTTLLLCLIVLLSSHFVIYGKAMTPDDALAARCFEYFIPERPDVLQAEQLLDQIAERFTGSEQEISIQKMMLKRHGAKLIKDYVEGPSFRYKVAAVKSVLSTKQISEIVEFYRSPLGIKYYALIRLMDSLEYEVAAEKLSLTIKEQREISESQSNGIVKVILESKEPVWYTYSDSTRNYFRRYNKSISRAISVDPYLFAYPYSLDVETEEERETRNRKEVEKLLSESNEGAGSIATDGDPQRALKIQMALRIPNSAKPCDQYLADWGASLDAVKTAANALGLIYVKDTLDGDDTHAIYQEATFVVNKKEGYYRIQRRVKYTTDELLAMQSMKQAADASFLKNWTVLDIGKYSGYGNCKTGQSGTVVHSRVMMNGEQMFFVERIAK
jgi:hypothetical protein